MSKIQIGAFNTVDELGKRDAFHLPSVLVTCNSRLEPGASVKFTDGTLQTVVECFNDKEERHAVVDIFLPRDTKSGDQFWVYLEPKVVGDLVHHFDIKVKDAAPQKKVVDSYGYDDSDDGGCGRMGC